MEDSSFRKRGSGLESTAQLGNLLGRQGPGRKLFERTEGDAIGLSEGAIDGTGFGHAHFGVVEDQGRDIAGMGVTVAHEAAALGRFIDNSFEDPEVLLRPA
jgi:hypothetical protein